MSSTGDSSDSDHSEDFYKEWNARLDAVIAMLDELHRDAHDVYEWGPVRCWEEENFASWIAQDARNFAKALRARKYVCWT